MCAPPASRDGVVRTVHADRRFLPSKLNTSRIGFDRTISLQSHGIPKSLITEYFEKAADFPCVFKAESHVYMFSCKGVDTVPAGSPVYLQRQHCSSFLYVSPQLGAPRWGGADGRMGD